ELKLDLHTHCREAMSGAVPTLAVVKRIVAAVRARGLDGIAMTEHYTDSFGREVREIMEQHLDSEIMVIPGKEIDRMLTGREMGVIHVVELYLPGEVTFRFIAHPGYPYVRDLDSHIDGGIHGIELRNAAHRDEMDEQEIRRIAEKHNLLLLTNSDAHDLNDIGTYYNEIGIEELIARARVRNNSE
ncbi:MAG: PHP domain-containing protein, partial [Dehalococcoidia bacterium]